MVSTSRVHTVDFSFVKCCGYQKSALVRQRGPPPEILVNTGFRIFLPSTRPRNSGIGTPTVRIRGLLPSVGSNLAEVENFSQLGHFYKCYTDEALVGLKSVMMIIVTTLKVSLQLMTLAW